MVRQWRMRLRDCVRERLSASVLCIYLYMCVYVFT
jgi:hypothetical protein